MLGLIGISHQLPSVSVFSTDFAESHGFDAQFITEKLGIHQRFELADDETVSSLATQAVHNLCQEYRVEVEQIDLLVLVTQTGDYCLPHVSAIVQDRAGMRKDVFVMDINLGCSGYVMGLSSAIAIMESQRLDLGVVVTVDAYSRIVSPNDRSTSPLFGDAASATLLGPNPIYVMGESTFGTDGSLHELLIAKGTGSTLGPRESLFMEGRGIFNFAMRTVPKDVTACLSRNRLTFDDVDMFIFHQANAYIVKALGERLGIPAEKLILHLKDVGNTTSSSIPMALEHIMKNEFVPETILISGFGVGLSWASSILTLNVETIND